MARLARHRRRSSAHGSATLSRLAGDIAREGFSHAVLLGMGGSSLGPEVFSRNVRTPERASRIAGARFDRSRRRSGRSKARSIRREPSSSCRANPARRSSRISSSSISSTCEERAVGADEAGSRFIAITDPGSKLQTVAERDRFRHVAFGVPSIGGRYSVLSDFGLVPAAVMGLDVGRLLGATQAMVRSCDANVPPADNPGVVLGVVLGVLAKAGRTR